MILKRLLKFANREYLRRPMPHGIISWRYLLPHPSPKVHIHRQLWLLGRHPRLPLPLYLLGECFLWLRWVSFACWRSCWRMVRVRGAEILTREGIGRTTQLKRILATSLCHCIPPSELYAFGLYRHGTCRSVWDYAFIHEIQSFHRWRSNQVTGYAESAELIQDKYRLKTMLEKDGIPMAPVLELTTRGATFDPAPHLHTHPRLFCKPCHGSASRDAFVIEQLEDGRQPAIFAVKNGMKMLPSSLALLREAMKRDDFLVQPLLINHPELAAISATDDVVTLRIITERDISGTRWYSATLEIPGDADAPGEYHIILPIDLASGQVMPFPADRLTVRTQARHDDIIARIGHRPVPFWHEIKTSASAAHQHLPGLYAIAWDYVISPDGPLMLEGNSGWGATAPQMLCGGLLRDERVRASD